jgi:enamine deaminase RidA (YjgF/YER057c/UK114 family)
MSDVNEIIKSLNITLPDPPSKAGIYTPVQEFGDHFLYCSGCGSVLSDGKTVKGKVGRDLDLEQGQLAARYCMLNILSNLRDKLGDLNRIKRFVKVLGFVNCVDDYTEQPKVINGGSQLLIDIFGEEIGKPARSAVGVNGLPGGLACEIEVLVEY